MRVFVFGDTGGHFPQLSRALQNVVGWDFHTKKLPEDVLVIHCGDIIHKGPSSEYALEMIDDIMTANPGQWIQLLGNHELQYVDGGEKFWPWPIRMNGQLILDKWVKNGQVRMAYALPEFQSFVNLEVSAKPKIVVPDKPILFTHSGVTWAFWKQFGFEEDAVKLAEAINKAPVAVSGRSGVMLNRRAIVGPAWAHVASEVWESWRSHDMPFIQVHGHTNAYDFEKNRWWGNTPMAFRKSSKNNPETRCVVVPVGGSLQIGIDPGYEKLATQFEQSSLQIIV